MKPVLLVRNDRVETFGLAISALQAAGVDLRIVDATRPGESLPDLGEVSAVVMFGGTANADEVDEHPFLLHDRELTREAVDRRVPYLGICLGAQILARALDRPVVRARTRELGFEPVHPTPAASQDPLLSVFGDGDTVFHWHEDTFELPPGGTLLATGDGVPLQAYRVGDLAWGIQWHLELDGAELELWLDEADALMDLKATWGKSSDEVRVEAEEFMTAHEEKGREVFRRFANLVRGSRASG